jgi:hypothetical protein
MAGRQQLRRLPICAAAWIVVVAASGTARSAGPRPLFEPTDLELEEPGTVQLDAQIGQLRGQDASKVVLPDFEIDLGLSRNVEFDIDGQYAIEGPGARGFRLDRPGPDNLWLCTKLGLLDIRQDNIRSWAFGVQLGPKVPVAHGNHGAGYEGLLLLSRSVGRLQAVVNFGALIDPGVSVSRGRPAGVEAGLDLNVLLSKRYALNALGELGGVRFVSKDAHQLHATVGISWGASSATDISLIGMKGLLSGGDQYGLLVGLAQRISLF